MDAQGKVIGSATLTNGVGTVVRLRGGEPSLTLAERASGEPLFGDQLGFNWY